LPRVIYLIKKIYIYTYKEKFKTIGKLVYFVYDKYIFYKYCMCDDMINISDDIIILKVHISIIVYIYLFLSLKMIVAMKQMMINFLLYNILI